MAMQLVEGGELKDTFADLQAKLDAGLIKQRDFDGTLAYLIRGTLHGLKAMQDAGLVHHDIKPENVMVDSETLQPMLVDMGEAQDIGEEGGGTAGYKDTLVTDSGKDVYAVGSTLFEAKEQKKYGKFRPPRKSGAALIR